MYRILISAVLLFLCIASQAQKIIDVNSADGVGATDFNARDAVIGQLYTGIKYVRVTAGTPFFKPQFMKAVLFDDGGGRYRCNAVRINLLDNEINFLGADGREMIASSPVRRIILNDSLTGANYYFIWGLELTPAEPALEKVWFQVLVNDETSLCRQIKKRIHETPSYGTATTDEDILSIDTWYIHRDGKLLPVKNWDHLLEQLQDQKPLLTQYIHDHHLKGKSVEDWTQLVTAYNAAKRS
jgi:hypothetical protein